MKLLNEKELEQWIYQVNQSQYCIKRFDLFPLSEIDFDWHEEMERLATVFQNVNRYDITFHNVRMLIKNLKITARFEQPLVGLYVNNNINIHPGGSRIMVANYLNISSIPLDLIIKQNDPQFDHYPHRVIDSKEEFLHPFNDIDSDMEIIFDKDESFGSAYSYQPIYRNQFHWSGCESIKEFVDRTEHMRCDSVMEYYSL